MDLKRQIRKIIAEQKSDQKLKEIDRLQLNHYPICVAKTQYSLSDDKNRLLIKDKYQITVKDINIYNGAGFITVLLGNILTMPGLSKNPNYEQIDV